jgi:hypothetical protein
MSTYDQIVSLPLCGGLTALGLVLSYFVMRRRGLGSGLRGAAWSLLPLAAYLTGSVKWFWKIGVAIADFAKGFVFSTEVWSGIAVAGLAVVLFMVSGPLRRRGRQAVGTKAAGTKAAGTKAAGREIAPRTASVATTTSARTQGVPAQARKGKDPVGDDDDLGDVEDILRRHGIT